MKLRSVSFAFAATAFSIAACSDFSSDSASTPSTGVDAGDGDGATGADGAIDPVGGEATHGITLTAGEAGKNVFVTQTKSMTVPVTVERRSASVGPIVITVANLPKDATADPLTIPAGATTGTLTLHAAATTPQGIAALDINANEQVTNGAASSTKLNAFVRGLPGTLDTTFGTGGVVNNVFGTSISTVSGAYVMPDASIIVSGRRSNTLGLARFTPGGVLDITFAGGLGRSSIGSAQGELYLSVFEGKPPADGFISAVAFGTTSATIFRAKLDGLLNTTFGGTGEATVTLGLGNSNGIQTFALPDGKALVLTQHLGTTKAGVVSRWNADGTLDSTYGDAGACKLTGSGTGEEVSAVPRMFLKPDGSVRVALGLTNNQSAIKGCSSSGTLDTSIGVAPDYYGAIGAAYKDAALYIDGGFVSLSSLSCSRVNAAFVGDSGFGEASVAPITDAISLLIQPDGGIVVGGPGAGTPGDLTLIRFTATGIRDQSFGNASVALVTVSTIGARLKKLVAQPDGRLLLLGTSDDHFDGFIARVWN